MLIWDESLATGNESIDQQHRRLFHFINNLEEEVLADPQVPLKADKFEFLHTYVEVHFASEELCMFHNVCSVSTQNKLAHQAFIQRVDSLAAGETKVSPAELLEFLQRWIVGHIRAVDRKMNECVDTDDPTALWR